MYTHILIATDGSELAERAVEQGLTLAKTLGSKVTAVTVTEPWTAAVSGEWAVAFPVEEYEKAAAANAKNVLAGVQAAAARHGVACQIRAREGPVRRRGHRRGGQGARLRSDRHGLPRAPRHRPLRARQPGDACPGA